ncbi:ATP-binding protein [Rheinheimera metallidurans]|uniref:ATP-binding protein n=1 Tax=Rheinheimera metallidurans TaxID=2925781 RepID=UPI003001BBD2
MAIQPIVRAELSPSLQINRLSRLRWGLIGFELLFAVLGFSSAFLVVSWPLIFVLLLTHSATNLLLHYLRDAKHYSSVIFIGSCITDLVLLSCLLALSGGTSNGLVALLLLPVAIGSVLLPVRISYLLALLAVIAYTLLLQLGDMTAITHTILESHQHSALAPDNEQHFSQHMLQMWWAFTLSAAMISWFVSTQAQLIRTKARQIAVLQQQQLQQEQAIAVATYAANAAHDLAGPIQIMALLADELEQPADVVVELRQQLDRCQHIVQTLRVNARDIRRVENRQPLTELIKQSISHWLTSRPEVQLSINEPLHGNDIILSGMASLPAAIYNILNNAADASLAQGNAQLELTLQQQYQQIVLSIRDFGEGLSDARLAELGHIPQPSTQGLGLGQYLANLTIESLGGEITRSNLPEGGMLTQIIFTSVKVKYD